MYEREELKRFVVGFAAKEGPKETEFFLNRVKTEFGSDAVPEAKTLMGMLRTDW